MLNRDYKHDFLPANLSTGEGGDKVKVLTKRLTRQPCEKEGCQLLGKLLDYIFIPDLVHCVLKIFTAVELIEEFDNARGKLVY